MKLIAPQGRFGLIDDPPALDVNPFKAQERLDPLGIDVHPLDVRDRRRSPSRAILLNEVSRLVDQGEIRTTLAERFGAINAANLRRAHALIESGRAKGKIVLAGFDAAPA